MKPVSLVMFSLAANFHQASWLHQGNVAYMRNTYMLSHFEMRLCSSVLQIYCSPSSPFPHIDNSSHKPHVCIHQPMMLSHTGITDQLMMLSHIDATDDAVTHWWHWWCCHTLMMLSHTNITQQLMMLSHFDIMDQLTILSHTDQLMLLSHTDVTNHAFTPMSLISWCCCHTLMSPIMLSHRCRWSADAAVTHWCHQSCFHTDVADQLMLLSHTDVTNHAFTPMSLISWCCCHTLMSPIMLSHRCHWSADAAVTHWCHQSADDIVTHTDQLMMLSHIDQLMMLSHKVQWCHISADYAVTHLCHWSADEAVTHWWHWRCCHTLMSYIRWWCHHTLTSWISC